VKEAGKGGSGDEKKGEERKRREPKPKKVFENAQQLYVNNLPFAVTNEELSAHFEQHMGSKPLDVDMVVAKFGKYRGSSRGFGFVTVSNSVLSKALELNSTKYKDRDMGVQVAKEREDKPSEPRPRKPRAPRPAGTGDANGSTNGAAGTGEGKPRRPRSNRGRGPRAKKEGGEATTAQ